VKKRRKIFRYMMIIVGFVFILKGFADLGLYLYGTKTTGHISYANRSFFVRSSPSHYDAHYTFTLPDKSLRTGTGQVSTSSGSEPSGSVKVVYFPVYPDYNSLYDSRLIVLFLLWAGSGTAVMIMSLKRLKKLRKIEGRAKNIFHTNNQMNLENSLEAGEKSRVAWIAVPVLIITLVGGYHVYDKLVEEESNNSPTGLIGELGNTVGNTANDSMLLQQNGKLFYVNWDDNSRLYSMSPDGTDLKKLTEESVSNLNGRDGWIYYSNFNDGGKLYRIREDGNKRSKIYKWASEDLNMQGEWLYLANGNDHHKLYKIKNDGSGEIQLNNDESSKVIVNGGWIYYKNKTDNDTLYRIRADGTERAKLVDFAPALFLVDGERIYFSNPKDEGKLYLMSTEGTDICLLSSEKAGFINMDEDYFYYSNQDQEGKLYRMKKDGSNPEKLAEIRPFTISISADRIFFIDFWGSNKLYFAKKDGSELRNLK
jgi:hypothetical protein